MLRIHEKKKNMTVPMVIVMTVTDVVIGDDDEADHDDGAGSTGYGDGQCW